MTERELQEKILELTRQMGILCYHTYDSRRSQPGFPDLVLVGANRVIYRELKSARGRLSTDQQHWMAALLAAGENAAVWRPSDWPMRIVDELKLLGRSTAERPLPSQAEVRRRLRRAPGKC